jgi:hypothetical protein
MRDVQVDRKDSNGAVAPGIHLLGEAEVAPSPHEGEAQNPGSAGRVRAFVDRLPRRRDGQGNRLASSSCYHDPYPDDRPIAQTPLQHSLIRIVQKRPARAGWLAHLYDDRLLPALRRFHAARLEAEAELESWNRAAERHNTRLLAEAERLRRHAEQVAAPYRRDAAAAGKELEAAHVAAAHAFAEAGLPYDGTDPSPETVLEVEIPARGALLAALGLPDPSSDRGMLFCVPLGWALTALVSVLIGISIGLMAGFLEPDALGAQWPIACGLAVLAFGPTAYLRRSIVLGHRQASERAYLGRPWQERWALLSGALLFDLVVLAVDLTVEREGLLRMRDLDAQVQSLSGTATTSQDPAAWWLAPLLISLGYVACSAWEGYLHGRRWVLENQLLQAEDDARTEARTAHLARAEVRDALEAVHTVREAGRRVADAVRKAEAAAEPFAHRIAALEANQLPIRRDFTPEQQARIQDALDNLLGADGEFRRAFEAELELLEPGRRSGPGLLGRRLGPRRGARQ